MNQENTPERRKNNRINKNFILSYYDLSNPDVKFSASQLKNISAGGICFVTSTGFDKGASLAIDIKTPMLAEIAHLKGQVIESKEKIKGVIYETRLQFEDLDAQALKMLNATVEYFEKESDTYE